jgi:hypothetical protein
MEIILEEGREIGANFFATAFVIPAIKRLIGKNVFNYKQGKCIMVGTSFSDSGFLELHLIVLIFVLRVISSFLYAMYTYNYDLLFCIFYNESANCSEHFFTKGIR